MKPTAQPDHEELVQVAVPRRHYALVLQTLARAMAGEAGAAAATPAPATAAASDWSREEVVRLRQLPLNDTVRTLMEMTCAQPGIRVSFKEVYEKAERTYHQARADLSGFTKMLTSRFGEEKDWPVHVAQADDGTLTYDADPAIADAWNSAAQ